MKKKLNEKVYIKSISNIVDLLFENRRLNKKIKSLEENRDKALENLTNMKNIKGGSNSTILQAVNVVEDTIKILKGEGK